MKQSTALSSLDVAAAVRLHVASRIEYFHAELACVQREANAQLVRPLGERDRYTAMFIFNERRRIETALRELSRILAIVG
jgi:hypothetical protein